tara:strand:+ start:860 stop:1015 length:156 start_codon:yes stop_codon:yes gene_type:complete
MINYIVYIAIIIILVLVLVLAIKAIKRGVEAKKINYNYDKHENKKNSNERD